MLHYNIFLFELTGGWQRGVLSPSALRNPFLLNVQQQEQRETRQAPATFVPIKPKSPVQQTILIKPCSMDLPNVLVYDYEFHYCLCRESCNASN